MTKSCWLKNPLLWEKKNRLCRNNNNNNLHFVTLGVPHIWGQQEREWEEAACQLLHAEPCPRFDSLAQTAPVTCFLLCHCNSFYLFWSVCCSKISCLTVPCQEEESFVPTAMHRQSCRRERHVAPLLTVLLFNHWMMLDGNRSNSKAVQWDVSRKRQPCQFLYVWKKSRACALCCWKPNNLLAVKYTLEKKKVTAS